MRKKLYILGLALIASCFFVACEDEAKEETTTTAEGATTTGADSENPSDEKATPEYETVASETLTPAAIDGTTITGNGYTITIPSNWTKADTTGIDAYRLPETYTNITILSEAAAPNTSIESYKNDLATLYSSTEGYNLDSIGDVTIDGREGFVIHYNISNGTNFFYGDQYILNCDGMYMGLTFVAYNEEYETNSSIGKDIISTFHYTGEFEEESTTKAEYDNSRPFRYDN